MTSVDEIVEAKGEAEWIAWKDKVLCLRGEWRVCIGPTSDRWGLGKTTSMNQIKRRATARGALNHPGTP